MTILAFPSRRAPDEPTPLMHVWRCGDCYEVMQEGRYGDSFGCLGFFPTREEAVRAALDALPDYPETKLGRIDE